MILSISLILFGCGIPEGKSIEDCMNIGSCYYSDRDVKIEDSELALSLRNLLIDEADDIYFSYMINPGGDSINLIYQKNAEVTNSSLDQLIALTAQMIEVVNQHYEIDVIETIIKFESDISISVSHDQEMKIIYLVANLNSSNSDLDEENQVIIYLDQRVDTISLLLEYGGFDRIWWYGSGSDSVYIDISDINLTIWTLGVGNNTAVRNEIQVLLEGYNFDFATDG